MSGEGVETEYATQNEKTSKDKQGINYLHTGLGCVVR